MQIELLVIIEKNGRKKSICDEGQGYQNMGNWLCESSSQECHLLNPRGSISRRTCGRPITAPPLVGRNGFGSMKTGRKRGGLCMNEKINELKWKAAEVGTIMAMIRTTITVTEVW